MTEPYIPYSTQDIDEADIAAVTDALKGAFITQGPAIEAFEKTVTEYCKVPQAVAVSSGTAALHIALAALDVGQASRVWTSPITFVGTANAARMLGADVDFVDVEPGTGNIDPAALAEKLQHAQRDGDMPHVLIVVHFGGRPCDMPAIHALCQPHGITIVEDAAHALGAQHEDGCNVGCCQFSEACIFSFHPVKSITTGEGGMVTTRSASLAKRLRRLRTHGITRDVADFVSPTGSVEDHGAWYYEQLELGYNYRITDIQAALGVSQMRRLDEFIGARRRLAARYPALLADLPVHLPPPSIKSAWHLYVINLTDDAGLSRRQLFDALRTAGIGVNAHYIPVHLQPYYAALGFSQGDFPAGESYYAGALSLPLYPKLTSRQQDRIASTIRQALQ